MNVQKIMEGVICLRIVQIQLEALVVPVKMGIQEMEWIALVKFFLKFLMN